MHRMTFVSFGLFPLKYGQLAGNFWGNGSDQLLTSLMSKELNLPVENAINLSVEPTAVAKNLCPVLASIWSANYACREDICVKWLMGETFFFLQEMYI